MKKEDYCLALPFLERVVGEIIPHFDPNLNIDILPKRHYRWNADRKQIKEFPFVQELKEKTGLDIVIITFFSLGPGESSTVHNDSSMDTDAAINFTVVGGKGSNIMRWFDIPDHTESGHIIDPSVLENLEPVAQITIDTPTLVDIKQWHQVENSNKESHRLAVTMRFRGNPSYEECKTRIIEGYNLDPND